MTRLATGRPVIGVTAFLHLIDDTFEAQICGNRTPQAVAEVAGGLPLILPGLAPASSASQASSPASSQAE